MAVFGQEVQGKRVTEHHAATVDRKVTKDDRLVPRRCSAVVTRGIRAPGWRTSWRIAEVLPCGGGAPIFHRWHCELLRLAKGRCWWDWTYARMRAAMGSGSGTAGPPAGR